MNIHLPAILMFTRGTRFWHTAICLCFFYQTILKFWEGIKYDSERSLTSSHPSGSSNGQPSSLVPCWWGHLFEQCNPSRPADHGGQDLKNKKRHKTHVENQEMVLEILRNIIFLWLAMCEFYVSLEWQYPWAIHFILVDEILFVLIAVCWLPVNDISLSSLLTSTTQGLLVIPLNDAPQHSANSSNMPMTPQTGRGSCCSTSSCRA